MNPMERLRLYHLGLALLTIAAYLTAEWEDVHEWLGYGAAAMIVVRLALAATGLPQLGLFRFYPHFAGLTLGTLPTHPSISRSLLLGIAASLVGVVATGITMAVGGETDAFEEAHELLGNLVMLLVGLHVVYLLLFKRPLARFMAFLPRRSR